MAVTVDVAEGQVERDATIETEIALVDDAMPKPVTYPVTFRVVESRRKRKGGRNRRRKERNAENSGGHSGSSRGLPQNQWLTSDGRRVGDEETLAWSSRQEDCTDQDGGFVDSLSVDEKRYLINYDNAHFQHFLRRERDEARKRVVAEQFRLGMLILMMGFEDAYSRTPKGEQEAELDEVVDQFRRVAARGAATVVMSIAKTLPQLVNADTVGDADD